MHMKAGYGHALMGRPVAAAGRPHLQVVLRQHLQHGREQQRRGGGGRQRRLLLRQRLHAALQAVHHHRGHALGAQSLRTGVRAIIGAASYAGSSLQMQAQQRHGRQARCLAISPPKKTRANGACPGHAALNVIADWSTPREMRLSPPS